MMNTLFAYHFAASSIQSFLLDGGKLKDVIGASEIVAVLAEDSEDPKDLLAVVLTTLNLSTRGFSRRGGGVFTLYSQNREDLERLRDLWSLVVRQFAPGLPFQQGLEWGGTPFDAIQNAQDAAERDPYCFQPTRPVVGPLVEMSARTGHPACEIKFQKTDDETDDETEYLDVATVAKRQEDFRKGPRLAKRVTPTDEQTPIEDQKNWIWPILLEPEKRSHYAVFPFLADNHIVAVIHADGNDFGNLLKGLKKVKELKENGQENPENYPNMMMQFSRAITKTTEEAAQEASMIITKHAVNHILPGRPIVLGGDDLTFIVRADFALEFTRIFLEAFERFSQKNLAPLRKQYPTARLPEHLTACAGVAFIKSRQPFFLAFKLAGSLCKFTKKQLRARLGDNSKTMPSAISFHRIASSVFDDYQEILDKEMTIEGDYSLRLTLQPYGVGLLDIGLPKLVDLEELLTFLDRKDIRSGPVRQLLTMLRLNLEESRRRYGRWRDNINPNKSKKAPKGGVLDLFDGHMMKLLGKKPEAFPGAEGWDKVYATPLGDAMALLAVGSGKNYE